MYQVRLKESSDETPQIQSDSILNKFPKVFPNNLLGVPPDRPIDFGINVLQDTSLLSILPYKLISAKLKELKDKLKDLLDKGFIQSRVSFW